MFPFSSSIYWNLNGHQRSIDRHAHNRLWMSTFCQNYHEAIGRYKVTGVPETCSEDVIMESLLCTGSVGIDISKGAPMSLPAMPGGMVSAYGYSEASNLYSANGTIFAEVQNFIPSEPVSLTELRTEVYGAPSCAYIRENRLGIPFLIEVIQFTDWMVDTMESLDIARENSKDLFILLAEEAVVKSLEKLLDDRSRNRRPIRVLSTGIYEGKRIQLTPTDTTINHLKPLTALYEWYSSEFRQKCGKAGVANPDKEERLNIPETKASIGSGQQSIQQTVDYLNNQMDKYNPLLGTSIRFEVNQDNAFSTDLSGGADDVAGSSGADGAGEGPGNG